MNRGGYRRTSGRGPRKSGSVTRTDVGFSWDRAAANLLPEPINIAIALLERGVRLADSLIERGHDVETRLRRNLDRFSEKLEELRM